MSGFKSGFVSLDRAARTRANPRCSTPWWGGRWPSWRTSRRPPAPRYRACSTRPEAQIVFLDTPGIHKADSQLNKRLMDTVRASLEERDLLLFVADASRTVRGRGPPRHRPGPQERDAGGAGAEQDRPGEGQGAPAAADRASTRPIYDFADYVPVSASKGEGLDELRKVIVERLPEGPAYFPEDHITDQPERFLAAELVREKMLAGHAPGGAALGRRDRWTNGRRRRG